MKISQLPLCWQQELAAEFEQPYFQKLEDFLNQERQLQTIFPPEEEVFAAFELTPYKQVNVLLLGQDPYHDYNQGHGLCFSVRPGIKLPRSLMNIFQEMQGDIGLNIPNHGYLTSWAKQGVLMLNSVLTVRAHEANSHKNKGWEKFTDAVITKLNQKRSPVIFVLWGGYAKKKLKLIDPERHTIIQAAHPSPLSAHNGFFGSKPFSTINAALKSCGKSEINWQLPKY
ncbi:Uracil-DNA glycosylase, family 1 [Richelia intracellularis]|nr:Uracil-DNA glycosylase, family 1 [Richelia intracellularis]